MKIDEKLIEAIQAQYQPGTAPSAAYTRHVLRPFFSVMRERREEVVGGMIEAWHSASGRPDYNKMCAAFDHLFPENPND